MKYKGKTRVKALIVRRKKNIECILGVRGFH